MKQWYVLYVFFIFYYIIYNDQNKQQLAKHEPVKRIPTRNSQKNGQHNFCWLTIHYVLYN